MRTLIAMRCGQMGCFGCSSSNADSEKKQLFEDVDSLWEHICKVHAAWIPFECVLCPKTFMLSEAMLKSHYQQAHAGLIPKAIYSYEEGKKELVRGIFMESLKHSSVELGGEVDARSGQAVSQQPQSGITVVVDCDENTDVGQAYDKSSEPLNGIQKSLSLPPSYLDNSKKDDSLQTDLNESTMDLYREEILQAHKETYLKNLESGHWEQEHLSPEEETEQMGAANSSTFRYSALVLDDMMDGEDNNEAQEWINEFESWKEVEKIAPKMKQKNVRLKEGMEATNLTTGNTGVRRTKRNPLKAKLPRPRAAPGKAQLGPADQKFRPCLLCGLTVRYTSRHIWSVHMEAKRFTCNDCHFQTIRGYTMRLHAEITHRRTAGIWWTDHMHDLADQYEETYRRAFADTQIRTYTIKQIAPIDQPQISKIDPENGSLTLCRLCDKSVDKKAGHIWHRHMSNRYMCSVCNDYGSDSKYKMKRHIQTIHMADTTDKSKVYWVDCTKTLAKKYATTYDAAYGGNRRTKNAVAIAEQKQDDVLRDEVPYSLI